MSKRSTFAVSEGQLLNGVLETLSMLFTLACAILLFLGAHQEKKMYLVPALICYALFILYCIIYFCYGIFQGFTESSAYFGVAFGLLITAGK